MRDNVYRFRRIKWGDPVKLKVLAEDIAPRRPTLRSSFVVVIVMAMAFGLTYAVTDADWVGWQDWMTAWP